VSEKPLGNKNSQSKRKEVHPFPPRLFCKSAKRRERRDYTTHRSNPVCISRRKIAAAPCLCVGTSIL